MSPNPVGSSGIERAHLGMDSSMNQPSGHRGNWLGIPFHSPRGPLKKMTSAVFSAKSGMSFDMTSASPSESSTGSVIHYPMQPSGNSSSPDYSPAWSPKTIHLAKTRMTTSIAGSPSVKSVVMDQPMEHRSLKVSLKVRSNLSNLSNLEQLLTSTDTYPTAC